LLFFFDFFGFLVFFLHPVRNSFCNQIIRPRSILVKKPLDPRKFPSAIDPMPKTNCARTFLSGLLDRKGPFSGSRFSLPFASS
jgi:hypothetical protein